MTFKKALQLLPVQLHRDFKIIGSWAYNIHNGLALNQRTTEKIQFNSFEEFVIEKRILEEFIPEWDMQTRDCGLPNLQM